MSIGILLIDLQWDFLQPKGRLPVREDHAEEVVQCATCLLEAAPRRGWYPIFIVNRFSPTDWLGNLFRRHSAIRGSEGAAIDPRISPIHYPVFDKAESNAFSNADLDTYLKAQGISDLVAMGVKTEACVRATTKAAIRRGYQVTVLSDGVGSHHRLLKQIGLWLMRRSGARIRTTNRYLGMGPNPYKARAHQ